MAITGSHRIRALKSALVKGRKYWPKIGDRMELRRHALKLRFWNMRYVVGAAEGILDLSYESIKSMPNSGVYELRVDEPIGGHRNIRLLFLVPPITWGPAPGRHKGEEPVIWLLEAVLKKRDNWTTNDIDRFWALRDTVQERFYN